jgi:hypothetical protein
MKEALKEEKQLRAAQYVVDTFEPEGGRRGKVTSVYYDDPPEAEIHVEGHDEPIRVTGLLATYIRRGLDAASDSPSASSG